MTAMYAVQLAFSDDDTRLGLRPQHRERLATLAAEGRLLAAGPWADESGALLIFTVAERAEVDALLAEDPYYAAPGVTVSSVRKWTLVAQHEAVAGL